MLELYRFEDEVEIEPTEGGLILCPARRGMTFVEAQAKLFSEKRDLLRRLSDA